MRKISTKTVAVAATLGAVMALVGPAAADGHAVGGEVIVPGYSAWNQGQGYSLYAHPTETLIGIGTATPKAALHVHNQHDANLDSTHHTAIRLTTNVKNGQDVLLVDSNEILAGRSVEALGSVPAYVYPSRLSLQHEGGEVMLNGGTDWWTLIGSNGVDTSRVQIRSTADLWPGSPNGPLVVGSSGLNVAVDGNEIMARSNGAPSELHLNAEGGSVILHGHEGLPESAKVVFYDNGRVRIGNSNATYSAQAKLSVDGLVVAEELRVTPEGWADYVFDPGYPMRSIEDLEAYVRRHRHLPGIPSEQSVMKDGLPLASFSTSLLRNVEELTLRVVAQSKTIEAERRAHEKQLAELRQSYDARLAKLEAKLDRITVK